MLFKFLNMSLIALWHVNALCLLIPLMWWGKVIADRFVRKSYRFTMWGILFFCAIWLAAFTNDSRNPTLYGFNSWRVYPALLNFAFQHPQGCTEFSCVPNLPAASDIDLIKSRTHEGEPVAIIDLFDWTYLIEAHRPPMLNFLPSADTFTKHQLSESLRKIQHARYLFLIKEKDKQPHFLNDDFRNALMPTFFENYEYDGEGERLVAWRRKI